MASTWGVSFGSAWGVSWDIRVTAALTGGHFGFDEKKRRKRWEKELESEQGRLKVLREAFYGLPEPAREEAAEAIFDAPAPPKGQPWRPIAVDYARTYAALQEIERIFEREMAEIDDEEVIMLVLH